MPIDPDTRFFFLHVMKTGGTTFRGHIDNNFDADQIFPDPAVDTTPYAAKADIRYLQALSPERIDALRMYSAHVPIGLTDRLDMTFTYLTVLRDPVDRTVSWLRQRQRNHQPDESLEQIYDQQTILRANYIDNHQVKQFAITADDGAVNHLHPVDMDAERLAIARANLDRVAVVGFQDRFDDFLAALRDRFGWVIDSVPDRNVGHEAVVHDELWQRIDDENPFDRAFYDYARGRVA
ncbi:MAG: sulfotransferase family 2 domain-containing protein [Acidimicrobiales bacterium]